ncbi:pyridoxal 5'-phosphate synthase glutaminase subunit PdxT [Heliobacterium gestii]|uniref:Pyridoxal 5'-phosphate synthase subunit PdxT n=1 Tax=Heliomicrobium gestii TaxID=2699 RepID=A0A845LCM0_HELGE|nr:pyridoxal 5'-phosphate synthase glutaminase subunit PdxT [Heliomicrobium gestii]MBM7868434.1 5'-phosphate synthase pdxT subunit [Heliomicrobium gestii]MZP44577.1 pyridoxal 5'-phosphate synthase glutaminase subunit PdxT [Heliomicrobium gestii]
MSEKQAFTIGVLAMQGAFREHEQMLQSLGCAAVQVRQPEQLDELDGLILPGGESTTIGKLMADFGLDTAIRERAAQGMPLWGTCAGLILLAQRIERSEQKRLGLMDITAVRNAFGRQVDSFEIGLAIPAIDAGGESAYPAVFIRAPYIAEAGPDVQILAQHEGKTVLARQGHLLASAFHPELTKDNRMHRYFLAMVAEQA